MHNKDQDLSSFIQTSKMVHNSLWNSRKIALIEKKIKSTFITNRLGNSANEFLALFLKTYFRIYSYLSCETVKRVSVGLLQLQCRMTKLKHMRTPRTAQE